MKTLRAVLGCLAFVTGALAAPALTYYVDPRGGDDQASGTDRDKPWRTLVRAQKASLSAGDRLLLRAGVRHTGQLCFEGLSGTAEAPIVISSYSADNQGRAMIDGRNELAALRLRNCRYVTISDLVLTADSGRPIGGMRCGALVEADGNSEYRGITLTRLHVKSVSFENPGFKRPASDARIENGEGRYGWGIRFLVPKESEAVMRTIVVRDCRIERVDHIGLNFSGPRDSLRDVVVQNVEASRTGGPGVQMSGVTDGHFSRLSVDHSGSTDDSRNRGRGSGLWTWGTKNVVIERSRFTDANGPGDSCGVHIDFNCEDVVVQHSFSARNAGGFCEILGNNRNCAYRYNISVNDGHRVKGKDGAFQEGKIFWLSGYVGRGQRPSGPFNSYFYNNTIYVDDSVEPKFTIAPTAEGVLVANNIFHIVGRGRRVASDQSKAEKAESKRVERAVMAGNLFLHSEVWPGNLGLADSAPAFGDAAFAKPGGDQPIDYVPGNSELVRNRGQRIMPLPGDKVGLALGLQVAEDILGRPVKDAPDIGAIELP